MRLLLLVLLGWSFAAVAQPPEYYRDIAPLIARSCQPCHRGGDIGPMALTSYEEVAAYGQMIAYVTREKLMPPFRAVASAEPILGSRRLTATEIAKIGAWVNGGMKKGEKPAEARAPAVPDTFKDADLTLSMEESFEQYGVYYDQYRVFVLPTGLQEDKWVTGVSFEPGNRGIVKGVMISVDTTERHQALDDWDPGYGYFSFGEVGFVPAESRWYTWAAGQEPERLPEGQAKWLPKGARLLVHLHYGPTGVPQRDSSVVKLQWADQPIKHSIRTAALINPYVMTNDTFALPANEVYRVHAKFRVPYDLEITNIFPHAHFLGRKFDVFATFPDGRTSKLLLRIDDWDFHFKQGYTFRSPIFLPEGTIVHSLVTYDNTSTNLANPNDPPRDMSWGKGMYEEMMLVYFSYRSTQPEQLLKPGPVNFYESQGAIGLNLPAAGTYRIEVTDFSGTPLRTVSESRVFGQGHHQLPVDLTGLPFGNYLIQIRSEEEVKAAAIFLYLASGLFD